MCENMTGTWPGEGRHHRALTDATGKKILEIGGEQVGHGGTVYWQ